VSVMLQEVPRGAPPGAQPGSAVPAHAFVARRRRRCFRCRRLPARGQQKTRTRQPFRAIYVNMLLRSSNAHGRQSGRSTRWSRRGASVHCTAFAAQQTSNPEEWRSGATMMPRTERRRRDRVSCQEIRRFSSGAGAAYKGVTWRGSGRSRRRCGAEESRMLLSE